MEEDEEGNYIEKETDKTDSNWFNYEEKRWANAKTKDGSYWVWIPRYAYKIIKGYHEDTDDGKIDVKFLQGITNLSSDDTFIETSGYDREIKNTRDNYFLHPAFKFGDDIPGFWVAKFSSSNSNNNVKVVLNASIWRSVSVSDAFNLCREMETKTEIYGWSSNEVDTHMIKNMEWGAVAYLSKSQYGANGKVWHNSYNQSQTGCSSENDGASTSNTCIAYNTENGVKASTTHTIYGVYDMRGGAYEYLMGNLLNGQGKRQNEGAGFSDLDEIDNKYIDEYTVYHSNKYGDAIYETSKEGNGITAWDGAYSYFFVLNLSPWFLRGGYCSDSFTGVFSFLFNDGDSDSNNSFRPIVVSSVGKN